MEIDPGCQMEVETSIAAWKVGYKGKIYYFYLPGCKRSFKKEPEKYSSGAG